MRKRKRQEAQHTTKAEEEAVSLPYGPFQTAPSNPHFQVLALDNQATGLWAALYKKQYAIVRLPSFLPLIGDSQLSRVAIQALINGVTQSKTLGATKLIVDIRGNAGGLVCAGLIYSAFLQGDTEFFTAAPSAEAATSYFGEFDLRKTAARTKAIASSAIGDSLSYAVGDAGNSQRPLKDIYSSGDIWYERGGQNVSFSPRYTLDCYPFREIILNGTTNKWNRRDMVVLTDGMAISTGSIFVRSIYGKITVVGMGGIKGKPMDTSFSPGAPVWTSYATFAGQELCPDLASLDPVPASAGVRYNIQYTKPEANFSLCF